MNVNIQKNGIIKIDTFTEFLENTYDKEVYVEPDKSAWIRIAHHNNPSNALFESSDPFASQVYKDADRWFNIALCNYLTGNWEMFVKQRETSTSTEYKYRWIQTVNPMIATYAETAEENITKITTTGYSTFANGGLWKRTDTDKAYMSCHGGSTGNWHGAFGSWSLSPSLGNKLPGWNGVGITTGYMDLYLRLDSHTNLNATSLGENYIKTKELKEV